MDTTEAIPKELKNEFVKLGRRDRFVKPNLEPLPTPFFFTIETFPSPSSNLFQLISPLTLNLQ